MAVDINRLWEEKISNRAITDMVYKIARGDKDLYQEGLIGIRDALMNNPNAPDDFLIRRARWSMSHYRNRGCSIDNGAKWLYTKRLADGTVKKYRKNTLPIYIDAIMEEFDLEFPDISYPPDILAIDRICAERFYNSLDRKEAKLINACIDTMSNYFYNSNARRKLKISRNEYNRIKRSAYDKFIQAFGMEDEILAS
jgi:hypothetical protein